MPGRVIISLMHFAPLDPSSMFYLVLFTLLAFVDAKSKKDKSIKSKKKGSKMKGGVIAAIVVVVVVVILVALVVFFLMRRRNAKKNKALNTGEGVRDLPTSEHGVINN